MGAQRLKEVRKSLGLTQTDIGEKIGIPWSRIKDIESGKQKLGVEVAEKIEEIFSINGWWLLTGKGSMLLTPADTKVPEVRNNGDMVSVSYYPDDALSAGYGISNHSSQVEVLRFSANWLRTVYNIYSVKSLSLIPVRGGSMMPTIPPGVLALVQNDADFIDGAVYAVVHNGEAKIKRLHKGHSGIKLISDNPSFDTFTVEPEDSFEVVGRVVGHMRIGDF